MDDTVKLIPINLLELILKDSNYFSCFIKFDENNYLFGDTEINTYLNSLNNYMTYITKNTSNLSRDYFEHINYINTYFKTGQPLYNYEEYLSRTEPIIPINTLLDILRDDAIYNKFINFEENKDFFNNIGIETYMSYFNNLQKSLNTFNISFTEEMRNRYNHIFEIYALKLKEVIVLNGYNVSKDINLDSDFLYAITKNIPQGLNKFSLARILYIELARLINYDESFKVYEQDLNHEFVAKIYNKSITDINLENNKLVCKTWAELYSYLLNKFGIDAVVNNDKYHKFVSINCDGTLIVADATNTTIHTEDNSTMNDITRIKLGFDTIGFNCPNKNIEYELNLVDESLKYNKNGVENELKKVLDEYTHKKGNIVNPKFSIEEKLGYINQLLKDNTIISNLEIGQYLSSIKKVIFSTEELDKITLLHGMVKDNSCNNYEYIGIFSICKDYDTYDYYSCQDKVGTMPIKEEDLLDRIDRKEIIIISKKSLPIIKKGAAK